MGCILDPTPEMCDFSTEVRNQSFYVRGPMSVYDDGTPNSSTVEIDIADISKVRAALYQVEKYLRKRK